jgi:phosphonate transport system permease protein
MATPARPSAQAPAPKLPERKRDARETARLLFWFVVIVIVYVYGYQVTDIKDPLALFKNWQKGVPLATSMVQPTLIQRDETIVYDNISLAIQPKEGVLEPATRAPRGPTDPELTASTRIVHNGDKITIEGKNFPPNAPGRLIWESGGNQQFLITELQTDPNGHFTYQLDIPEDENLFVPGYWFVGAEFRARNLWFGTIPAWKPDAVFVDLMIPKMIETVFMALIGTTLSTLISVPISFLAARNLMGGSALGRIIYFIVRMIFNITRSIEILIFAVIFAVIVGFGSYAGVLAVALHGIGANGKLYAEAIEDIDQGPIEAIRATGGGPLQVVMYGVVPQIFPQFLAFTIYRWDINVRMATVLGLVGGGGIGSILIQYINLLQWNYAAAAIWLIVIVVMIMDFASGAARSRIV